ncbi:MAG: F0F1 ATP synthase subunit epsilon [Clostridiales bacterium]|nr:F0F1 ATP synthase subunit epsilon [Clostridiales bacterium]
MAKSVKLQVITPSKLFYEGEVELVIVKTLTGEEGYMANHSWACKLLDVGEIWIQEAGSKTFKGATAAGGFVDVMDDIIIYTDAAEWSSDIDKARALHEQELAESWLSEHNDPDENPEYIKRAMISVSKQKARVHLVDGVGRRRK